MLLRAILCVGVFGTDSFLARPRRKTVLVDFVDGDGHLFPPPLSLLLHVRELPEFASLMSLDRSKWPRCLLWHCWLPGLSGAGEGDPWASFFFLGDPANGELERCLGAYPVDFFWFLDSS